MVLIRMSDDKLIESLTALLPPRLRNQFHGWLTKSASFKDFGSDNEARICRKIREAKIDEDKADMQQFPVKSVEKSAMMVCSGR